MDATTQIALIVFAVSLQTIFVFLRFYALKIYTRRLRKGAGFLQPSRSWVTELIQDIFTTLVWVISVAFSVYQSLDIRKNEKTDWKHREEAETTEELIKTQIGFAQAAFFSNFLYIIALWCIKGCFLVYYTHVAKWSSRPLRIYIYIVDALVICGFLILSSLLLFWCKSPENLWLTESQQCYVLYQAHIPLALFVIHLVTDLLICSTAILILHSILTLVPRRERNAIAFMIFLASSTMSMAILRFTMSKKADHDYKVTPIPDSKFMYIEFVGDKDQHRLNIDVIASGFEVTMGVIVACLPSLKVLVRSWIGSGPGSEKAMTRGSGSGASGEPGSSPENTFGWREAEARKQWDAEMDFGPEVHVAAERFVKNQPSQDSLGFGDDGLGIPVARGPTRISWVRRSAIGRAL
ncbi:hypothetical protein BJ508DRAFT_309448 [Ascobolus immersus RN42]|uniref:Rhodopsin domain-containing protein n=1 Tax=Ascobolus immersus RN42 TaxID=1160509 RepID=A0A3N4I1V0_ASCIM|nr:hypothetical protein BJ508DRAFT_309448 [Ascobolus immersus RN42]